MSVFLDIQQVSKAITLTKAEANRKAIILIVSIRKQNDDARLLPIPGDFEPGLRALNFSERLGDIVLGLRRPQRLFGL